MNIKIVPVILSGGTGSRLWPVSRQSYPKQFWPLLNEHSLIQDTAIRGQKMGLQNPIVICNAEHRFIVAEQLRDVGISDARIVLEPVGRNSAPAIAAAAFLVAETDPDAILWIMAADAAITDEEQLGLSLEAAVRAAKGGRIVTFGMQPTRAETGYGYIERGAEIPGMPGVHTVSRFIEKPSAERAADFLSAGTYLWNSGMFVARASVLLSETKTFEPDIFLNVGEAVAKRTSDMDFERLDPESFSNSPEISVDYAIAERTALAAVVAGNFGWSDIGSWDSLWDLSSKDTDGNAVFGDVFLERTRNCYVRSDGGIVATVTGVENLIVIVTQDAVMVTHRDCAQDVKKIVTRLAAEGRKEAAEHNRNYRPWGFYESLTHGNRFHVKRIMVKPQQKLSLQKHFHRAEHWVVVAGTALVTRGTEQLLVRENESIYLPLGALHRLENPGKIPLVLIEVQSGPYLGEDDIVRIEDDYQRE